MTLRNLFLLLFFGAITVNSDAESGYFTVIGSKLMRPNKPYRVSLHHQGYSSENSLEIAVKGESFNDTRVVSFSSDGDKEVVFEPPQTLKGEYRLEVKSLSGANFESSRKIEVNRKQFSVFVQTDKSIYKPADKVQFRVLLLDSETRPYRASKAAVFVTDGAGNRVKQFDSLQFRHGVYENALQLSELPVLGKWKINVKVDSETTENSKEFEVAEYVLPKFEFTLDANPDANFKDGKITATARAKYTFGKVAKGNATITAEKKTQWWGDQSRKVTKTVAVDGKKFVEFDIENELGITQTRSEHTIELLATFTEELSGKEQNATAKVQIHITPHKIEMRKGGEKFKPGLNYKVTAIVKYHDKNAPVTDAQHPLNFTTKFFYDVDAKCKKYKHGPYGRRGGFGWRYDQDWSSESTNEEEEYECREEKSYETAREIFVKNGIAELDLEIPSNTTRINVEAKYHDTVVSVKGVEKEATKCNEYIQAKLLSPSPALGKKIAIEVQSTNNLKQLTYQVIGSGSVIKSETVRTPNTKKFVLSFMSTDKMAPKSQVIVFYIASNGEMISDKVDIEFPAELRNQIDLQLSANQAKPGSDLEISVSTKPNSFVGLLGVDQSVLVLKKGNDIEASQVLNEQKKFGEMKQQQKNKSDYKDFKDAIIITNIKSEHKEVKKPLKDNYNYSPRFGISPGGGRHQMVAYSQPIFRAKSGGSPASSSAAFYSGRTSFNAESISLSAPQNRIFGGDLDIRSEDFDDRSLIVESRPPKPRMQPKKPIEVRKVFPETWMFDSIQMAANESSVTLKKKVPDTITSWIVTGFSLNAVDGLGLTKEAAKLSVFQPFFVSTNLPYSVKRGEIAAIPVVVFNYLPVDQDVEVTFANGEREFEFVEPNEEENRVKRPQRRRRAIETERKKILRVRSNEGASVRFMVRPLKVGHLTVKVTAESNAAGDAVEQPLLVIPEGVTHFENEAVLVDLRDEREFATSFDIFVPQSTVPDSIRIEAAATGDILGPSIENLDKLIKLPYGCGEQNMLNFVPNIVVLDYLTAVGKLSQEVEEKARGHLETGYQRELSYKHNDGSYSAFGGGDSLGSTWLTAFVARSFNQASRYVDIEQKVIREALEFLRKVQSADGSFHEVGRILSKSMQGGASKGIALTAYTLITFLENMQHSRDFGDVIERAIEFILANMDSIEDDYSLAIASYALQLAQNRQRDEFLAKINGRAVNDNGLKFWKRSDAATAQEDSKPDSVSIEMTAYALLAFVEAGRDTDALAIGKWLVAQRNENGGFQSTQDTVVGLQALAKLAAKIHTADGDVAITLRSSSAADGAAETRIKVDGGNALVLQKFELPPTARRFEVEASGRGLSLLQVSYRYNIADALKRPRFTLEPTVGSDSNADYLRLTVCSRFVPPTAAGEGERSNMAVMEVSLPSGFTYDTDHVAELERSAQVKKVELKEGDTRVIVYFDSIGTGADGEVCPEFKSYRTHGVAKQKPSPVVVYDYYDTSRAARAFYSPPTISLCDICSAGGDEDEECTELCESPAIDFAK